MKEDHGTFCYRWNGYKNEMAAYCKDLYKSSTLSDVTLVSDDNKQFSAHKIVLAASSPVFETMLLFNEDFETQIFLQGVGSEFVELLLKLIYLGETEISSKNFRNQEVMDMLECFGIDWLKNLHVEDLGTEQLLQEEEKEESQMVTDVQELLVEEDLFDFRKGGPKSGSKSENIKNCIGEPDTEILQNLDVKTKKKVYSCIYCGSTSFFGPNVKKHILAIHKGITFPCKMCPYKATHQSNLRKHVLSIHEHKTYNCKLCEHKATNQSNLRAHHKVKHMKENKL